MTNGWLGNAVYAFAWNLLFVCFFHYKVLYAVNLNWVAARTPICLSVCFERSSVISRTFFLCCFLQFETTIAKSSALYTFYTAPTINWIQSMMLLSFFIAPISSIDRHSCFNITWNAKCVCDVIKWWSDSTLVSVASCGNYHTCHLK